MRKSYLPDKETVTECPICGVLLLEGPGMTRKEKAIQRLKGHPNYKNIWKHICNHWDESDHTRKFTPAKWKEWDQKTQTDWIVKSAKEYLVDLGVDF